MSKNLELEQECIYKTIGLYNSLIKRLERVFAPFNISVSKFNILMVIKHQSPKEGISQVDIGSKLIVGDANIAKIANKLFEQGYITRKENPKDRRYNLLKITPKGSKLLDDVWIIYLNEVEKLTKSLTKKDKKQIIEILSKWNKEIIEND